MESNNSGTVTTYTYSPSGLRASKSVNGVQTNYVLDGDNVVLELQADSVTSKYIRAINLVSSTIGSTTNYYLHNAHGDVVQLANASGAIAKSYDYDAFGNEKNIVTNDVNPFRYCGEYYDLETNTYYLRARNYDPTTGRFLEEDTYHGKATDPLSLNLYTYCSNNPIVYVDPSGHVIQLSSNATETEKNDYSRAIAYLSTSETGKALIKQLSDSKTVFTIVFITDGQDGKHDSYDEKSQTIYWDSTAGLILGNRKSVQSPALALAHEMGHGKQDINGTFLGLGVTSQDVEEANLIATETPIAKELGEFTRKEYSDASGLQRMSNSTDWGILQNAGKWYEFWNWGKKVFVNKNGWTP